MAFADARMPPWGTEAEGGAGTQGWCCQVMYTGMHPVSVVLALSAPQHDFTHSKSPHWFLLLTAPSGPGTTHGIRTLVSPCPQPHALPAQERNTPYLEDALLTLPLP